MSTHPNRYLLAAFFLSCETAYSAPPLPPGFYPLGELPGRKFHSHGYGISGDGSVAVGISVSANGPEAFRWTAEEGMVGLGNLPGPWYNSSAHGASADGAVIVGASLGQGFRWTADGGMVAIGSGGALGVSADGAVLVGRSGTGSGEQAYRWTEESGQVGLGDLPGGSFNSHAYDVSGDGAVVVGIGTSASGGEAFRWTAQTGMVGMGDLRGGAFSSQARGVSADGGVIVGYGQSSAGTEAFRWTPETEMVGLGDLPGGGFYSHAIDVSADGAVIVGHSESALGGEVIIWDEVHGMRSVEAMLNLDLSGWAWISAEGISDDGSTLVGWGYHPDIDANEAWIAVLPPPLLVGASSWRTHGGGVDRDSILIDPSAKVGSGTVTSEPRSGGISELRLAFDGTPRSSASTYLGIEQRACGDGETYVPYSGASTSSATVVGNELVLIFTPALENARTYRITVGPEVSSIYNQSIEVRSLAGDIDSSGRVDATDRSIAVGVWTGPSGYSAATDVDLSGRTNGVDRSIVVGAWTGTQNCAP